MRVASVVKLPRLSAVLTPTIANELHRESSLVAEGETQANQPPSGLLLALAVMQQQFRMLL